MKMKLSMILIALAAITVSSCKKTLDINKDPNNPSLDQLTPKLVFPAATISAAGRIGGRPGHTWRHLVAILYAKHYF